MRDAVYYMEVRWLICGRMLKNLSDLKSETELFVEMKRKNFLAFVIRTGRGTLHFVLTLLKT